VPEGSRELIMALPAALVRRAPECAHTPDPPLQCCVTWRVTARRVHVRSPRRSDAPQLTGVVNVGYRLVPEVPSRSR
jgi:hypothetical protein